MNENHVCSINHISWKYKCTFLFYNSEVLVSYCPRKYDHLYTFCSSRIVLVKLDTLIYCSTTCYFLYPSSVIHRDTFHKLLAHIYEAKMCHHIIINITYIAWGIETLTLVLSDTIFRTYGNKMNLKQPQWKVMHNICVITKALPKEYNDTLFPHNTLSPRPSYTC